MAKYSLISDFVAQKFEIARNEKGLAITEIDLAKWGLERAKQLKCDNFKASKSWVYSMKKR